MAETISINQREPNHGGGRYEGEMNISSGQREGNGKYFYQNPYFQYEGSWVNGHKEGHGRFSLGDGSYYEGSFQKGEISGQGVRYWSDGSKYRGQFQNGGRHGEGIYEKRDGLRYEGSWEHNKYTGEGMLDLPNGDNYTGLFRAHKYHGEGMLQQPEDERTYEGFFVNGDYHGRGQLTHGSFAYTGLFMNGMRHGDGNGADRGSGVSFDGLWFEDMPQLNPVSWDFGEPGSQQEGSYLLCAALLHEEAKAQLELTGDPKKDKKKDDKKGKKGAEEPVEPPPGPELELIIGKPIPEVIIRLQTADKEVVVGEIGRQLRVSMHREKRDPAAPDPATAEILKRPICFGDKRPFDPLDGDGGDPKAAAKKGKAPDPAEDEEPPSPGQEFIDLTLEEEGLQIGGSEEWMVPVHAKEGIVFLRIEDITDFEETSPWQRIPVLEMPVRMKAS